MLFYIIALVVMVNSGLMAMNADEAKKPDLVNVITSGLADMSIANDNAVETKKHELAFDAKAFGESFQPIAQAWHDKSIVFCTLREVDNKAPGCSGMIKQCHIDLDKLSTYIDTLWFLMPAMDGEACNEFLNNPDEENAQKVLDSLECSNTNMLKCWCAASFFLKIFDQILAIYKEAGTVNITGQKTFKQSMEDVIDFYLLATAANLGIFQKMELGEQSKTFLRGQMKILLEHEQSLYQKFGEVFLQCDRVKDLAADSHYKDFVDERQCIQFDQPAPQARWRKAFEVLSDISDKIL